MKSKSTSKAGLFCASLTLLFMAHFCVSGQAANCFPPPPGLISWWRGESNALDQVSGNDGSLVSGITFAPGAAGQAFLLNGTTAIMHIPASPTLNVGAGGHGLTVEAWLKPNNVAGFHPIFEWNNGTLIGVHLWIGSTPSDTGVLFANVVDTGGNSHLLISGANALAPNLLQHVALTYDPTTGGGAIYLDGTVVAQANLGVFTPQTAVEAWVSSRPGDHPGDWTYDTHFDGLIDELSLYNRALSQTEIQAVYSAAGAGKCVSAVTGNCATPPAGIVGWWKSDGNALDSVANNNGVLQSVTYNPGMVGQAFACNQNLPYGTYSGVQIADQPAYALTNSLSIEGWVKPRGDGYVIFFRGDHRPGLDPYILSMQGNNDVRFQICDQNANYVGVDALLAYTQWTHVAATLDGNTGNLRIYTNGVLAAQTTTTVRPFGNLSSGESPGIGIGNVNDGGNNFPFMGDIDEIALYNRALSASEIQSIYNSGSAGKCTPVAQTNNCTTPPTGLAGWWPAEGSVNDVVGTDNGTLQGGAGFAAGKVGQGFRFDGTNGYVQIPDSNALKPANVTCEAWVWLDPSLPAGRGGEQIVFKKNTWSAWFEGYSLLKITIDNGNGTFSDRFQFCVSRSGNQVAINSQTLAQRGVWYHVAATYDGNQSRLYVNGVLEASATPGFALDYDTTPIFIGTSGTWAPYLSMFGGIIDEPTIYNRALSASEIQSIYNAGSAGKCATYNCVAPFSGLAAWWRAEGDANDTAGASHAVQNTGVTFANGEAGQGFVFNGSAQLKFPANAALNVGAGSGLTFETWIRPGHFTLLEPQFLCEWNDGAGGNGVHMLLSVDHLVAGDGFGNAGVNFVDTLGNSHGLLTPANVISTNAPQHLACTYDRASGQAVIYVNGIPLASTNLGSFTPQTTYDFYLGNRPSGPFAGNYFNGLIDEPTLYNRALTAGEILAIVNAGSAGKCVPAAPTNNCVTAPAGLVAWWPGNGSTDELVHSNNGTLGGGTTYTNAIVGQGFNFDGLAGRVTVPNSPLLNFGPNQDLSIECWIKAFPNNNPSNVRSIVEKRNVAENYRGYTLFLWDGFLAFQLSEISVGVNYFSFGADLRDGVFHHVAVTVDRDSPTGGRLYVDGQIIYTFDPTGVMGDLSNSDVLRIGQHAAPGDGSYFPGVIDDVSIYNRALATSEIQSVYNARSAGKCAPGTTGLPTISNFSPAAAAPGGIVTIFGNNFHPFPADNTVYFGAVKATVLTASANLLTVQVPAGATFAPITETVNGLTAYAGTPFIPTFAGTGTMTAASFAPRADLGTGSGPDRVAFGDLDGDGKPDMVVANVYDSTIWIYRNISTNGALSAASFAPAVVLQSNGARSDYQLGLALADLDGDGRLDIVVADGSNNFISIFKNLSSPGSLASNSFEARLDFPTDSGPNHLAVQDLDGDGRPEIVTANVVANTVSIFRNLSVPGSLTSNSFAPAVNFPTSAGPSAVAIADLDGDGKPDLITANGTSGSTALSVLRNVSVTGSLTTGSFAPHVDLAGPEQTIFVATGDLDGDGKQDLVTAAYANGQAVSVYQNISTPGNLTAGSFATRVDFPAGAWAHTVTIGDLDGDGKPDLAVASELPSQLSLFKNTSTPGSFTAASLAARVDLGTGWNAWSAAIGDLDGDGRPDLALGNAYDGTVSLYRNLIPFGGTPFIQTQPTNQTVTVGNQASFNVLADGANPLSYQWQLNGTNLPGATNASLALFNVQLTQAGNYSVLVSNLLGGIGSSNALLTVNPAVCLLPPAGLISWWRGESNALDQVSGNDGSLVSGITFAPGAAGQAFLLNGTTAIMHIPASPTLNVGAGGHGLTVEAWLKPNNVAGFHPIFEWNNGTLIGVHLWIGSTPSDTGVLFANVVDTGGNSHLLISGANALAPNLLQHVALTYDPTTGGGAIYLDGTVVAQANLGVFTPQTAVEAWVSSRPGDHPGDWTYDTHFDGLIDELSLYNRALSQTEIQAVYSAAGAGKCNVPVAPSIVLQPQDVAVPYGTSATFSVVAGGTVPLSYQWFVNNTLLPDETNTSLTLPNLQFNQNGNLYSVSITNSGGAITSSNAVLTVINNPPQISGIAAQRAPFNTTIGPVAFTVSDAETPADQLVVTAFSANNNIVPTNQIVLGGTGTNRTVTILPGTNAPGTTSVTLTVTDALGAFATRSFSVTWDQFTEITPALPALQYSAAAWGDYDNDGKLDLLVSGTTNGSPSGAVTRIYHNDNGVFTNFISLPGLFKCALAWSDYDRDGRLDIAINGLNSTNLPFSRIYHNNGDGTFTEINAGLTGCYSGTMAWGDFNNDGAADLYLSGLVTTTNPAAGPVSTNILRLYRNDGNGTFTDMNLNLIFTSGFLGPNNGTTSWGDYDNDGRPDLLLVGQATTIIYRNLGNGSFTNAFSSALLSGSASASGTWGDYDNDGWLDFAISGTSGTFIFHNNRNGTFSQITSLSSGTTPSAAWGDYDNDGDLDLLVGTGSNGRLYRNNGNGTFTDTLTSLPPALNGTVAWGDFDNDGDLDAVFLGSKSTLMRNNGSLTNTPPAAPFDLLSATALTNSVVLTWHAPADSQTKSNGLNYNLRVGTTPGGVDIVSPMADPTNGWRRVAALGNAGPTNRAQLINLPQGTYYWSVQAIDTAFAGSPFAALPGGVDRTFIITNARPVISDIADQVIAPGTNTPGLVVPFIIGDAETFAGNLIVTVRSSNTNVVASTNLVVTRGVPSSNYPSNCTVRVTARTNGVAVITVTVADAQGAFANDNFTVRAEQFSLVGSNFVQVENSSVAWGDFDNDGDLDVVIAGNTNGIPGGTPVLSMTPATRLYRNDGNGNFVNVPASFPGVSYGSLAWNDYDNDGNLDLLLTGTTNNQASGAIARIYHNNGNGTFTDINAGLPGVFYSAVAWGDYDNDGRADILITGTTNAAGSGTLSRIYRNNGDGTFSNAVTLPGIYQGAVAFADFDGDGDLDLVLAGINVNVLTSIYRNNGTNNFTLMQTSLAPLYNCSLAVGDADNDGRPDILLSGFNSSYQTVFYRNSGVFSFTPLTVESSSQGARYTSAALGDFDNDGRLDVLLSGTSSGSASGGFTRVYRNTGSFVSAGIPSFALIPTTLPTNYLGAVSWADYDNDGDLDILVTGTDGAPIPSSNFSRAQTMLFRNNSGITNTPPTVPAALTTVRSNNVVAVAWAKTTDAQTTNSNGLKYQLRIGTTPGGLQTESPLADLSNGYRRVVRVGDASTNRWQLLNLPPGTYYWSVQAIDTAFAGSPFAAENSFIISRPPVVVPDSISTAVNTPINFPAAKLTVNDLSPDGYPLTVIAISTNGSNGGKASLATGRIQYTAGSPTLSGNDIFTYTVTDGVGGFATGNFTVTVGNGGAVSLNIVYGPVVEGGNFVVRFAGIPGFTYTVEWSPGLNTTWFKAGNITAPTTDTGFGIGVFEFREPMTGNPTRFYRTVYPAY